MAAGAGRHGDPLVRQEIAALETGYRIGRILVMREVLEPGAGRVLGRHEVLLHRARAARRRVRRPRLRRRGHAVERRHPRPRLRARLHDHGRHVEHHAQHPRRARPRPPPRTPLTPAVATVASGALGSHLRRRRRSDDLRGSDDVGSDQPRSDGHDRRPYRVGARCVERGPRVPPRPPACSRAERPRRVPHRSLTGDRRTGPPAPVRRSRCATHIADVVNQSPPTRTSTTSCCSGSPTAASVVTGSLEHVADRVRHLVYLDAFVPGDGDTVARAWSARHRRRR